MTAPATTTTTTIEDALNSVVEQWAAKYGIPEAIVSMVLTAAENFLTTITNGVSQTRKQVIDQLQTQAMAGNANALQQLYNWAFQTGAEYPHGAEVANSISYANQSWAHVAAARPVWAKAITGGAGKNGDPSLDPGGPTLTGTGN